MGLNATVRKLLTRNPGSSAIDAARVRNSAQVSPTDVANSITSVQRQIDAVVTVALADQTVSDPITVSGEDGGQIGWIGTVVQNAVSYLGMWFQNFWLGGTSPATAQIYSDSIGDVFIDGAEIVNTLFELNLNGVTTSIENLNSAVGVLSIKSLSNSTLYYSGATPTGFELLDNLGNSLGSLRSSGGSGHLDLSNVAATNTINLITGGGGAPKLSITSAAGTVSMSPGIPFSVFGTTVVDSSRVITGTNVVTPFLNGATIPITGPLAANASQQLVAATAGAGITLGATSIANSGVLSNVAGGGISVSGATGNVTISNAGVTSVVAGTGISVSGSTGGVTITNTGITSLTAGTGISVVGSTITNTAPFPGGGFTGSILLIGPTTNGSITVVDGIITGAVDPT